jgi:hypothetical protein
MNRSAAVLAALSLSISCSAPQTRTVSPSAASATPIPVATVAPPPPSARELATIDLGKVGDSHFATSCEPAKEFDDAVALLHSFFYEEAHRRFAVIATEDGGCALAHWGLAMTLYHPVWTGPTPAEFAEGKAAAARAVAIGGKTPREQAYINAIAAFYAGADSVPSAGPVAQSCHGPVSGEHHARALAYEKAMKQLAADFPDDVEATVFYALALLGAAPAIDATYANQLEAARILEELYPAHPHHPGINHYLIHAYDYPELAARGLPAAKAYAAIAPQVPHALHMPSHIFTRLALWQESIDSNVASAEAARNYAAFYHPGATYFDELHALDYLEYAYLQIGDDKKAKELVEHVATVDKVYPAIDMVAAYGLSAIPARFAMERHQWSEAAALTLRAAPYFEAFPFAEANVELARGVGAARSGDVAGAQRAVDRLRALREKIRDPKFQFFATQVEMQAMVTSAWLARAQGKNDEARKLARQAADLEDILGKHPISPGAIIPARELLADMLVELKEPGAALVEYETSLRRYPGRFYALAGAARAAELAGKAGVAKNYYAEVLSVANAGDGTRLEIAEAKKVVDKRGPSR